MWPKRLIASPPLSLLSSPDDITRSSRAFVVLRLRALYEWHAMFHFADHPRVNTWHSTLPPPHNGILASCMQPTRRTREAPPGGADQSWIYQGTVDTGDPRMLVEGSGQDRFGTSRSRSWIIDDFFNAIVPWQQPLLERIHLYSHAFPNASQIVHMLSRSQKSCW